MRPLQEGLTREEKVDIVQERQRRSGRLISSEGDAILVYQELFKVPCDIVWRHRRPRNVGRQRNGSGGLRADTLQESIHGMDVVTINHYLF